MHVVGTTRMAAADIPNVPVIKRYLCHQTKIGKIIYIRPAAQQVRKVDAGGLMMNL